MNFRHEERTKSLRAHRASSRRWDFCNSSTWLMLMEKYPALGQSFRIYAQAQMYNLLKFQPRLCCQSIPPPKSQSTRTQGPSFFSWHLWASSQQNFTLEKEKVACPEFSRSELRKRCSRIQGLDTSDQNWLLACLRSVHEASEGWKNQGWWGVSTWP